MTEEIIEVNGLNVSRCTHLSDCLLCDYTENHSQFCSDYDNCYYKQLKRLEQENKELKEEKLYRGISKQFIEDANDKLYWENKKYHSALEEIRENLVKLKTNDEDDFTYEYSKIEDKINEVLND